MSRALLGSWAVGVDDETLAAALLELSRADWSAPFASPPVVDAKTLAAQWRARKETDVAVQLPLAGQRATGIDHAWLSALVARDPSVVSVALVTAVPVAPVRWTSPAAVVGIERAWFATRPIDVLVDPGPLHDTLARIAAIGPLPRVQTLLVLDAGGFDLGAGEDAMFTAQAELVAVVSVPDAKRTAYVQAVVALLEQNELVEVAFARVAREQGFAPPLLLAAHADVVRTPTTRGIPGRHVDRYLQAELRAGDRWIETAPLAPGAYTLGVWIGAPATKGMSAPSPFPLVADVDLPLTVVVTAPQLGDPIVKPLVLPAKGDSGRVTFDLSLPEGLSALELRIAVLHENRVAQTVLLRADVGAGETTPLALELEGVVVKDLGKLAGRRPFQAALVANALAGQRSVTVYAKDRASLVAADGSIDKLAKEIGAALALVTNNASKYGTPDTRPTIELLCTLARKGVLFRDALLDLPQVRDDLKDARRIQIIAAKPEQETLPIELCYDGAAPVDGATICPGWKDSLATGAACTACAKDPSAVVCPIRFWGLSRTIERHAYAKIDAAELGMAAYALQSEPGARRERIKIENGALCAAADKARAADAAAVDAAFAAAGKVSAPGAEVKAWDAWKAAVQKNPSLLVLLSHSDEKNGVGTLVIGADDDLFVSSIDAAYVGEGGGAGPIVMLLGCSTAVNGLAYQSYVGRFRRGGASIVVGTLCEILGRHAGAVAGELLGQLEAASHAAEPMPLGELMSAIRRNLLAKGLPIVLAVTSYGDADWRI